MPLSRPYLTLQQPVGSPFLGKIPYAKGHDDIGLPGLDFYVRVGEMAPRSGFFSRNGACN